MTLPTSGIITAAMINTELGRSSTAPLNLNDAEVRDLAGKPSGAISFSDFYGASSAPVIAYMTNVVDNTRRDTMAEDGYYRGNYTFTNIPIGTASTDRIVVIGVHAEAQGALDNSLWGCTINGVQATSGVRRAINIVGAFVFYAVIPSGTTATVSIDYRSANTFDFNGVVFRCGIGVYTVTKSKYLTPRSTATDVLNIVKTKTLTFTRTEPNTAWIVFATGDHTHKFQTWTNLNQDYSVDPGGIYNAGSASPTTKMMGGWNNTSSNGNVNVTITYPENEIAALAGFTWR